MGLARDRDFAKLAAGCDLGDLRRPCCFVLPDRRFAGAVREVSPVADGARMRAGSARISGSVRLARGARVCDSLFEGILYGTQGWQSGGIYRAAMA